jgi:hypothetical protein
MKVCVFPGRGMHLKHYVSYFTDIEWVNDADEADIVLCHSLGIVEAMLTHDKIVIAMDPTYFPNNANNVHIWTNKRRLSEIPDTVVNVHLYEEDTHYPYQIAKIRNDIMNFIVRSTQR